MSDDWSLLFDPAASKLELLDVTDTSLMTKIYRDNGSGWIKVAVVRDPVTRLLSAYLDIVRTWRTGLRKQEQGQELQPTPSSPVLKFSEGSVQPQVGCVRVCCSGDVLESVRRNGVPPGVERTNT